MKVWCHFDFEDGLRGHKSLVQVLVWLTCQSVHHFWTSVTRPHHQFPEEERQNYWFFKSKRIINKSVLTERKSVTSGYHGIKISRSQHSFLTEMAICIVKRSKKGISYLFVSECNNTEESHTCQFFPFFPPYLQDHSLLRSRNLATIRWWCDVTNSPLHSQQKL